MEILWNQINLQRPPYRSWDVSIKEFDSTGFIKDIDKILNDFKSFEVLHTEAALLSRLIYRMKSKFRSDKGFKHMEKVNRALLNYLNMSMEREYELLKEDIEINNGIVSLPPRQTLEYVLVRTQGFAKLMCHIESTALTAGNILKSRLHIGHSWTVTMIAYAVISRLWILSKYIIKKSCAWYNTIYNYLKSFKVVGIPWLPEYYILPENLTQWLDLPWINEDIEELPMKKDWEKSIFNLMKGCNVIEENDIILDDPIIECTTKGNTKSEVKQDEVTSTENNNDLGQPISRLDYEETSQKLDKETRKKVKKKQKYENKQIDKQSKLLDIKTNKDLVQLLTADSIPGLDKLQWNILRKRIKKLAIKLTKHNTCSVNKQMLRKISQRIEKWTIL